MDLFDFLEKYMPDYYQSNLIANLNDLDRYFSGQMEDREFVEKGYEEVNPDDLFSEYKRLLDLVFQSAYDNFQQKQIEKKVTNIEKQLSYHVLVFKSGKLLEVENVKKHNEAQRLKVENQGVGLKVLILTSISEVQMSTIYTDLEMDKDDFQLKIF